MKEQQEVKTFKQHLMENSRVDVLREKYKRPLSQTLGLFGANADERYEEMFEKISDADPSRNKQYLQWILNRVVAKNVLMSDLEKVKQDLTVFDRVKQRVPADKRDISRYKEYQDLYDVISEFGETQSKRVLKGRASFGVYANQIKVIYEGPEGGIYIPMTEAASCFLGTDTRWCTASTTKNYFNSYNSRGPLVIFIPEHGEKVQMHATRNPITLEMYNYVDDDPANATKVVQQIEQALTGSGEFKDPADRELRADNKFFSTPLFKKGAKIPYVSLLLVGYAIKHKDVNIFNQIKHGQAPLLKQIKEDAPEMFDALTDGGTVLSRFQALINMYEFVYKHF